MPVEIQAGGPRARAGKHRNTADQWLQETWAAYKEDGSPSAQERLITHYMTTFVPGLARNLQLRLPGQVDIDDLTQQGYLGLVDAITRFDPARGIRFETFSARRITGSMQDYLRALDPVPRLARTRAKRVRGAQDRFLTEFGRHPDEVELRIEMGLDDHAFHQHLGDARPAAMISLSGLESPDEPEPLANFAHGENHQRGQGMTRRPHIGRATPLGRAARNDLRQWVIRRLSKSDRLIIVLYYYEQMTMRDVGKAIGCSESRISQRLDSILRRLRSELVGTSAEFEFEFD